MTYVPTRDQERARILSEVAREARAKVDTVGVELDLTDDEMLRLCLLAHEKDMTLNEFLVEVLEDMLGLREASRGVDPDYTGPGSHG